MEELSPDMSGNFFDRINWIYMIFYLSCLSCLKKEILEIIIKILTKAVGER